MKCKQEKFKANSEWYCYIIKTLNGLFYVGISTDPIRRYKEHKEGKGAWFTKEHGVQGLVGCLNLKTRNADEAKICENIISLELAVRHGLDSVAGGSFISLRSRLKASEKVDELFLKLKRQPNQNRPL